MSSNLFGLMCFFCRVERKVVICEKSAKLEQINQGRNRFGGITYEEGLPSSQRSFASPESLTLPSLHTTTTTATTPKVLIEGYPSPLPHPILPFTHYRQIVLQCAHPSLCVTGCFSLLALSKKGSTRKLIRCHHKPSNDGWPNPAPPCLPGARRHGLGTADLYLHHSWLERAGKNDNSNSVLACVCCALLANHLPNRKAKG